MIINKIDYIEITQTKTILNEQFSASIIINDPGEISLTMEEADIRGGISNTSISTIGVSITDLFDPNTKIYAYGYIDGTRYGRYDLLTHELQLEGE